MGYRDLQEFVRLLELEGELEHIGERVDPYLEITEITDRIVKAKGPALLFENVRGHELPVLANVFGSEHRISFALGVPNLDDLGGVVLDFLETEAQGTLLKKLDITQRLTRLESALPKFVQNASCQDVVFEADAVDLFRLPIPYFWPGDGGPSITLPVVFTRHPETGARNAGMYRMQVFDRRTTGIHWYPGKGGALHYRAAEGLGRRLEIAAAIGPEPAMTYAATAPLPQGVDEVRFAGYLRDQPVELVKCLTVDLEVPASSQIVLEGYVEPGERRMEGPFGNHTGYYSVADEYPVFHVTCMTHRRDAVYPATIVGRPPQEDCYIAKATVRLFLPFLKKGVPEIVDMNLPLEGIFGNLAFVSIDKRFPGHARKVIHALWGRGQTMFSKILCIFDADTDVQDLSQVLWRLGTNVDPRRDVVFADDPVDALNHAAPSPMYGSTMGIDCTRKWPEEGISKRWPEVMEMDPAVRERVDRLWPKLGLGRK